MSIYIHKSHNVNVLIYHLVCVVKYRNKVITPEVEEVIKKVCIGIGRRYEIHYLEIGMEEDHVHFLIQSVPTYSVTKIVKITKSIIAIEVFKRRPEVKNKLWGGEFWTDGYYVGTVGRNGDENSAKRYIEGQGKGYKVIHKAQLKLF